MMTSQNSLPGYRKKTGFEKQSHEGNKSFFGLIQVSMLVVLAICGVLVTAVHESGSASLSDSLVAGSTRDVSKQISLEDSNNGYIVEFTDQPAFAKTELLAAKNQLDVVRKQHEAFKVEMLKTLRNSTNISLLSSKNSETPRIVGEYYKVYNGIALDIKKEDAEKLLKLPNVKRIIPNRVYQLNLDATSDLLNVSRVWSEKETDGTGPFTGNGVIIAMIDSGVEISHEMFGNDNNPVFKKCSGFKNCPKVLDAWDFVANDAEPWDDNGHGTHTASTAAGIADGVLKGGMAPDAKLYVYKVCSSSGGCSESAIVAAIERAADPNNDGNYADHANIISMSLGGQGRPDCPSCQAINNAADKGVISIVSAGNSGPSSNTIGCPACAAKAIAVAASCKPSDMGKDSQCRNGPIAQFSSRGPVIFNGVNYNKPEIAAPGVMICAARGANYASSKYPSCFDDKHVRLSGTSMAAPHMAGIGALIVQKNPGISWSEFEKLIQNTATSLGNYGYDAQGAGLVNPTKIFGLEAGTTPIPPTPPRNDTNSTQPPTPPTPPTPPKNDTNSTQPPTPPTPPGSQPEDVNKDGRVDYTDLILAFHNFRRMGCVAPDWCSGTDVNRNGMVEVQDLLMIARAMPRRY